MPWVPSPTRKPSEPPTATTNSAVSTEPTTLRGSSRPEASSDEVPTGPQPPPPTASSAPPNRPSGARKRAPGRGPNAEPARGQEPPGDVGAERDQDAGDHGHGDVGVEVDQQRRAGERADEAGHGEDADGAPVGVAERVVGEAGDQRGADLGEVDGRRRRAGPMPAATSSVADVTPYPMPSEPSTSCAARPTRASSTSRRIVGHLTCGSIVLLVTVPTLWTNCGSPDEIPSHRQVRDVALRGP